MEHLERIAKKPSKLELQHLTPLLNQLEETLGPVSQPPSLPASMSEQESGESTGFDDNSDEESDDDKETEENRAFINDNIEEEGLSFYHGVNLQLVEQ